MFSRSGLGHDTAWVITGGGGGVTAEMLPSNNGQDDAYGFMDMVISLEKIEITAISHGGVERSKTTVYPRLKPSPFLSQCSALPPAQTLLKG
ncbi:unnamed protein product [Symbiodinium sp. CCMP2456]|nr:unnamed protein product [Symbiodinium sp. CCMP2456]